MRLLTFILLTLGMLSCNSRNSIATKENRSNKDQIEQDNIWEKIDKKKDWFLKDAKTFNLLDSIPPDFDVFYSKFISDTTFQKEHIGSSMLGVIGECDSIIILSGKNIVLSDENWEYLLFDFRSDFYNKLDSNTVSFNRSKFLVENYLKEVGLIFQMGFEKKNDNWYLTLFMIDNC